MMMFRKRDGERRKRKEARYQESEVGVINEFVGMRMVKSVIIGAAPETNEPEKIEKRFIVRVRNPNAHRVLNQPVGSKRIV
jgi:hypothetical protein